MRKSMYLSLLGIVALFTTGNVNGQSVIDQSQMNYNAGTSARNLPGYSHWQSFTAGITGTMTQLDMGFFTFINATGTLTIYDGVGTTGTMLNTQTITVSCGGGNCLLSYPLNIPVIAGQSYSFHFIPGAAMPDPYGVQVELPGTYPGGEFYIVDPSGTYATGFDMVFQTWVDDDVTGIPHPDQSSVASVYVFDKTMYYNLPDNENNYTGQLFDMQGKLIQSLKLHSGAGQFQLNGVAEGVYCIRISDGVQVTTSKICLN